MAWLGVVACAVRAGRRLAAVVLGSWLALFVVGHLAWYYVYERFLVPALPAAALLAGALVVTLGEGLVSLLGRAGARRSLAGALAVVLGAAATGGVAYREERRARSLTDRHILEWDGDRGGPVP